MKCRICGKNVEAQSFCPHCGAYAVAESKDENAGQTLSVDALYVKNNTTTDIFYAKFKLSFAIWCITILFFAAITCVFIYYYRDRIASINILVFLVFLSVFFILSWMKTISYVIASRHIGCITRSEFCLTWRRDTNEMNCIIDGHVYRVALRKPYAIVKKNKRIIIMLEDVQYYVDVQILSDWLRKFMKKKISN